MDGFQGDFRLSRLPLSTELSLIYSLVLGQYDAPENSEISTLKNVVITLAEKNLDRRCL
jgi:thymidylate synthase